MPSVCEGGEGEERETLFLLMFGLGQDGQWRGVCAGRGQLPKARTPSLLFAQLHSHSSTHDLNILKQIPRFTHPLQEMLIK